MRNTVPAVTESFQGRKHLALLVGLFACACIASLGPVVGVASAVGPAVADSQIPPRADYTNQGTYLCKTDPILLSPGQNLNLLSGISTCPNAKKLSGVGPADELPAGQGYITYFEPSMVEVKKNGARPTPRVDDLHLHHVVWTRIQGNFGGIGSPQFAVGEEKTITRWPQGYGLETNKDELWGLNYMLHSLNASTGRKVEVTWKIDWAPKQDNVLEIATTRWMDVAGTSKEHPLPNGQYLSGIYPVFDAIPAYDGDRDGKFVFPDDVIDEDHPERAKISRSRSWTAGQNETFLATTAHVHPGGLEMEMKITRGDDTRTLFISRSRYFEPMGATSWDVTMQTTSPDWRIKVNTGDRIDINVTYDVEKAAWYESMGIMPTLKTAGHDPEGLDPFAGDDWAELSAILEDEQDPSKQWFTHGRLPENIDDRANKDLKLKSPGKLKSGKRPKGGRVVSKGFYFQPGGFSAVRRFPASQMRPALVRPGQALRFVNLDALQSMSQEEQAWHTVTSCKLPCSRDSGIGYPLATGAFDSGQLGYGKDSTFQEIADVFAGYPFIEGVGYYNEEVTAVRSQPNAWTAPKQFKRGTYAYFCRIHPFMRGSFRVAPKAKKKSSKKQGRRSVSAAAALTAPLPSPQP